MKTPSRILFLLTLSVAAPVVSADPLPTVVQTESLGIPPRHVFQATNCTITEVQFSQESIFVLFTGRWSPADGFSDTNKNGFSISREIAIPQATWDFLAQRFRGQQGKPVTITITTDGSWSTRGGIPLVKFPSDKFEITSNATK